MSSPPAAATARADSMMVNLSRLDTLLELAGEVIIVSANLDSLNRMVQAIQVPREIAENTKELTYTSTRISSDLHKLVVDVRNVDLRDMFGRFRRLVRDTSRRLGKLVQFDVVGEALSLDKRLVERIFDPIAHQLRNAIAHGIEDEGTRRAHGKDPVGRVGVSVAILDACIRVSITDDGGGIDLEKVGRSAVERGLARSADVAAMGPEELYEFLFMPGFSTVDHATTTAGRGVGMDVIRETIAGMDGDVILRSTPGHGTELVLELPKVSAVNIMDALLVRAERMILAFPLASVVSNVALARSDIVTVMDQGRALLHRGTVVPVRDILHVLGQPGADSSRGSERLRLLIIEHKGVRVAYVVSEFLRPQKLVITAFEGTLEVPAIAGAAILAGRRLAMIVDVPQLIRLTLAPPPLEGPPRLATQGSTSVMAVPREEASPSLLPPVANVQAAAAPREEDPGREFLCELEVLLSRLNAALLRLDERRDRDTTDEVFRLAHSIKGNFAMCNIESAANLTHGMETVLDAARQGQRPLSDESFDLFFDSCSHLEQVVTELLAGRPPPPCGARLQASVDALCVQPDHRFAELGAAQLQLKPSARFLLADRRRRGDILQRLTLTFDPQDQPDFLIAYLILRRIQSVGDVLASSPTIESIEAGVSARSLEVLFTVRDSDGERAQRLEQHLGEHFGVTTFQMQLGE